MVSKYSHHFFPKAPTLSCQSHSSRKPSTPFVERLLVTPAWPQACPAPPSPALLFNSGKSQLCARPGACTTLFTLFPTKSLLKSSLSILKRRVCLGFLWGGSLGVCVFGVSVCLGFVRVPSLQLQISLCTFPCPRKSAIVQFIVSLWYNFPATTSGILGENVCWRVFRDLNLTEVKPRLRYN